MNRTYKCPNCESNRINQMLPVSRVFVHFECNLCGYCDHEEKFIKLSDEEKVEEALRINAESEHRREFGDGANVTDEVYKELTKKMPQSKNGVAIFCSTPKHANQFVNQYLGKFESKKNITDVFEAVGKFRHNDPLAASIYKVYRSKRDDEERFLLLESLVEHLFCNREAEIRETQNSHFG